MPTPVTICDVTQAPWHAKGDGITDDTSAIQTAIRGCGVGRNGRGQDVVEVLLPRNRSFVSGALNLTSNLILRIRGTILASTAPPSYPVVPALEGYGSCRDNGYPHSHSDRRHQALISGWKMDNVWVDGDGMGVIDGRALTPDAHLNSSWVDRFRAKKLDFGRPRLYEPMFSTRVSLMDITLTNQAFWAYHPYACEGVYAAGVTISAPRDEGVPNDDGFDPDSVGE